MQHLTSSLFSLGKKVQFPQNRVAMETSSHVKSRIVFVCFLLSSLHVVTCTCRVFAVVVVDIVALSWDGIT